MQFLLYRSVIHYNSVCDDVIISHTNTNTNTYMLWNICGDIFVSICKLYMFCCGYMSLIFTITTAFKVTNFTMILFGVFWWYFVNHFSKVCWHISHEHINLFFFLSVTTFFSLFSLLQQFHSQSIKLNEFWKNYFEIFINGHF